jgi:hypothetical protein
MYYYVIESAYGGWVARFCRNDGGAVIWETEPFGNQQLAKEAIAALRDYAASAPLYG